MYQIEHFELSAPRVVALALKAGAVIRVSSGRLWLTVQDQPDDIWLHAGAAWTLPAPGTLWLSAEPAATFQVLVQTSPWRQPRPLLQRLSS